MRRATSQSGSVGSKPLGACLLAVAALMCGSACASGLTIRVDPLGGGDHLTIQEGIDAATAGDTVLVAPGVYCERLQMGSSADGVTLLSEAGPESTLVDGQDELGPPLLACSHVYSGVTVSGFTFAHGSTSAEGAAIRCDPGVIHIIGNVIRDNQVTGDNHGGTVAVVDGTAYITGNTIQDNQAPAAAGILLYFAEGTVSENTITRNVVLGSGVWHYAGGVAVWNGPASILDNRIEFNEAYEGGGVHVIEADGTLIEGNSFVGNTAALIGGALRVRSSRVLVQSNLFCDNTATRAAAVHADAAYGDSCVFIGNIFHGNAAAQEISIDLPSFVRPRFLHNYFEDACEIQLRAPLVLTTGGTVPCRENWWGTTDPVEIENLIHHCVDSADYWCVDFSSWCEQPDCSGTVTEAPDVLDSVPTSWGRLKHLFSD